MRSVLSALCPSSVPLLFAILVAGCATPRGVEDGPGRSLTAVLDEENERARPLSVEPGSALAALRDRHVLFVGGFLNEAIPGYFTDALRVTRQELGAVASVLFPSSGSAVSDDADAIKEAVLARFSGTRKPVVLVGHSKGGAGVLLCALRNPELVLERKIDCVISIQGAIRGSPVADAVAFTGSSSFLPFRMRGLESLTTGEAREVFEREVEGLRERLPPDELRALSDRIFYVRSCATRVAEIAPELQLTHEISGVIALD